MKLCKLPKILPGVHPPVPEDWAEVEVLGIAHDSRRVKPGSVFVAIRGHERDGNAFVEDALARGAVAIVSEKPVRPSRPVVTLTVGDARRALAALASAFYGKPSRRLHVIGVTGTNGKTTTTYMIRSILEAAGYRCGVLGTIGYETGRRSLPASVTTPESLSIQEYLAEMVAEGLDYAAMEVSSHSLCMRRVDFVQFAAAVFTNLSPEHMDYHRTLAAYREAKARLFSRARPGLGRGPQRRRQERRRDGARHVRARAPLRDQEPRGGLRADQGIHARRHPHDARRRPPARRNSACR